MREAFFMRLHLLVMALAISISILSCAGSGDTSPVVPSENSTPGTTIAVQTDNQAPTNRYMWGFWNVHIDSENEPELTYLHTAAMHFNVVRLLEVTPCSNCLTFKNFLFHGDDTFDIDLQLRHPFPGAGRYTGFDVRGLFMTNADYTFPLAGRSVSFTGENAKLLNADGFTQLFNPIEYPEDQAPFPLLGYIKGLFANGADPSATLNPFKAYQKDRERRVFLAGEGSTETLNIYTPTLPFDFGYAVDASWWPVDEVIYDPITQFPLEANATEAYDLQVNIDVSNLDTGIGSFAPVQLVIFDHQGFETISTVTIEVPGLFDGLVVPTHVGQVGDGFLYSATLTNDLGAGVGEYPVLVRVTDTDTDPNLGAIDAWQFTSVEVTESQGSRPVAIATADYFLQVPGEPVHFMDDGSYDPDGGSIVLYEWDFENDGIFDETGTESDHIYLTEGIYEVQLRVTDDEADTDMLDDPLEIVIDAGPGNLEGIIRDATDYLPIDGAMAETNDGGYQFDVTVEDGLYHLHMLPPGQVQVDFSCPGYIPASGWFDIIGGQTTVGDVALLAPESEDPGDLTGMCIDATTGLGISSVFLEIRDGINNLTGPVVDSTTADIFGTYDFFGLDPGSYTIAGDPDGYNPSSINVTVVGGQSMSNDITFSPDLAPGEYRIILTWAYLPRDLDSHLLTPMIEGEFYHIAFYELGNLLIPPYAALDRDDVTSYGPETVTIAVPHPGRYRYFVHHWADHGPDDGTIATTSDAEVRVYSDLGLMAEFQAPSNGEIGDWWDVFTLDGTTGQVTPIDEIKTHEPTLDE